jgi:hypothetical protein
MITNIIDCRDNRFVGAHVAASVVQSEYAFATDYEDLSGLSRSSPFYDVETDISVEDAVIWAGQYQCAVVLFLHDRDCQDFDSDLILVQIEATYAALRKAQGLPAYGYTPGVVDGFRDRQMFRVSP